MRPFSSFRYVGILLILLPFIPFSAYAQDTGSLAASVVFITADAQVKGTAQRRTITGSGVVVTSDGYVLTAAHVIPDIADPSAYEDVRLFGTIGSKFGQPIPLEKSSLVNADLDVVFLKLPSGVVFQPATLETGPVIRDSDIVSLSFPFGLDVNVFHGKITSLNGPGTAWLTDAKVNEGSSGGPVFDANGRLIGILSGGFQFGMNPHALDLNLVIPIGLARSVAAGLSWRLGSATTGPDLKVCRDPSNGVDHYAREFDDTRPSPEMGGGHGQGEWCDSVVAILRGEQPSGVFSVVSSSESSRNSCWPANCPLYTYRCTVHVKTDPVFIEKASPACK